MIRLSFLWTLPLACLVGSGCQPPSRSPQSSADAAATRKQPMHRHGVGPHGGTVFDLGKYHAEFVLDRQTGECHLHLLDDDEESPLAVPVKELILTIQSAKAGDGKSLPQLTVTLAPLHQEQGKTTRLIGREPRLAGGAAFQGTIAGEMDGKPSLGRFTWEMSGSQPPQ